MKEDTGFRLESLLHCYIGRIADDHVEGWLGYFVQRRFGQDIGLQKPDIGLMGFGIASGNNQCIITNIDGRKIINNQIIRKVDILCL